MIKTGACLQNHIVAVSRIESVEVVNRRGAVPDPHVCVHLVTYGIFVLYGECRREVGRYENWQPGSLGPG